MHQLRGTQLTLFLLQLWEKFKKGGEFDLQPPTSLILLVSYFVVSAQRNTEQKWNATFSTAVSQMVTRDTTDSLIHH